MLSVGLGSRCGLSSHLPAQSHQYLLQLLQCYQFLHHLGSSRCLCQAQKFCLLTSGVQISPLKSIWDGRNKEVKMNDNQCIEHSRSKNIIENVDAKEKSTNDYGVDLTANGAFKRLSVRAFPNLYLVTHRVLWSQFKRTKLYRSLLLSKLV